MTRLGRRRMTPVVMAATLVETAVTLAETVATLVGTQAEIRDRKMAQMELAVIQPPYLKQD